MKVRTETKTLTHWMAAIALAVAALSGLACRKSEAPVDPKRAAFQEANRALEAAAPVAGKDEFSKQIATKARTALIPVAPGAKVLVEAGTVKGHRRIVILARLDSLNAVAMEKRKGLLEDVVTTIEDDLSEDDEIIVGLRDGVFYGAIGQGIPQGDLEAHIGSTLDTAPLETALAEMKAAP